MFYPDGRLYYPASPKPSAPWIPEVFGNATLVNGKLLPYLDVEPRRYRFRILNGSNTRFYHLALSSGHSFHQIGCDQGLLPAPVELKSLVLAPGERGDIVIDFANQRGKRIIFSNNFLPVMQFRVHNRSVKDSSCLASCPAASAADWRNLQPQRLANWRWWNMRTATGIPSSCS